MINKADIFSVGQIIKTHGLKGEMAFNCTSTILEDLEILFIILEPEGLLVPFYVENVRMKTDDAGFIKLERIDSEEQAREYIGLEIYLPNTYLDEIDESDININYFIGFQTIDENEKIIGTIIDVDQTTANTLFVVETDADEILIPAVDEYIMNIDHDEKKLQLNLPEGLLDL